MAQKNVTLARVAVVLNVHPRTVVRAITGTHNTYWTEDINESLYAIADIAKVYGISEAALRRCIEGRDTLLKPNEAAETLGIRPRTFRDRVKAGRYPKVACGGIVRYLRSKIVEDAIASRDLE